MRVDERDSIADDVRDLLQLRRRLVGDDGIGPDGKPTGPESTFECLRSTPQSENAGRENEPVVVGDPPIDRAAIHAAWQELPSGESPVLTKTKLRSDLIRRLHGTENA